MPRNVNNSKKEPFVGSVNQRAEALNTYFSSTLPNPILVADPTLPIASLTESNRPGTTGISALNLNTQVQTGLSSNLLDQRQAACEGAGSGDKFQHLTNLANSQDPSSPGRCGWIYNVQNPQQGAGAYGTSSAPYKRPINGQWMWDLKEAKQKVHAHLCRQVQSCGDLASPMYQGRCGFCSSSGKAVPIENGRVAYPYDPNLTCEATGIITAAGSCPPLPTAPSGSSSIPGTPGYVQTDVCAALPNGALKRDCLIQKATQAGCQNTGTMIQALRTGCPSSPFRVL